jgi:hypothetical protein
MYVIVQSLQLFVYVCTNVVALCVAVYNVHDVGITAVVSTVAQN